MPPMTESKSSVRGKYVTGELPGTGGRVRAEAADFYVEEIPLTEPEGAGEHLYLWVEKTGWPTLEAVRMIGRGLEVPESALGYAGLKDARAITRQWVSAHLPASDAESRLARAEKNFPEGLRVLRAVRGRSKLRRGALRGNRFEIRIRDVGESAAARAGAILEVLRVRGLPNAFGDQRFGSRGHSAELGRALALGEWSRAADFLLGSGSGTGGDSGADAAEGPWLREAIRKYREGDLAGARRCYPRGWEPERRVLSRLMEGAPPEKALRAIPRRERVLYGSALQAAIFNACLAERIEKDSYGRLLPGDVAVNHESGKAWRIGDPGKEADAWARFEVSPSGPLLGERMLDARGEPGGMEAEALLTLGLSPEDAATGLAGLGLRGGRRPYRVRLEEPDLREDEKDLILRFALPPGAYATEVLREVTKNEPPVGAAARLGVTFRPEKPLRNEKGEK